MILIKCAVTKAVHSFYVSYAYIYMHRCGLCMHAFRFFVYCILSYGFLYSHTHTHMQFFFSPYLLFLSIPLLYICYNSFYSHFHSCNDNAGQFIHIFLTLIMKFSSMHDSDSTLYLISFICSNLMQFTAIIFHIQFAIQIKIHEKKRRIYSHTCQKPKRAHLLF